jgi:hypothetical protein
LKVLLSTSELNLTGKVSTKVNAAKNEISLSWPKLPISTADEYTSLPAGIRIVMPTPKRTISLTLSPKSTGTTIKLGSADFQDDYGISFTTIFQNGTVSEFGLSVVRVPFVQRKSATNTAAPVMILENMGRFSCFTDVEIKAFIPGSGDYIKPSSGTISIVKNGKFEARKSNVSTVRIVGDGNDNRYEISAKMTFKGNTIFGKAQIFEDKWDCDPSELANTSLIWQDLESESLTDSSAANSNLTPDISVVKVNQRIFLSWYSNSPSSHQISDKVILQGSADLRRWTNFKTSPWLSSPIKLEGNLAKSRYIRVALLQKTKTTYSKIWQANLPGFMTNFGDDNTCPKFAKCIEPYVSELAGRFDEVKSELQISWKKPNYLSGLYQQPVLAKITSTVNGASRSIVTPANSGGAVFKIPIAASSNAKVVVNFFFQTGENSIESLEIYWLPKLAATLPLEPMLVLAPLELHPGPNNSHRLTLKTIRPVKDFRCLVQVGATKPQTVDLDSDGLGYLDFEGALAIGNNNSGLGRLAGHCSNKTHKWEFGPIFWVRIDDGIYRLVQ